MSPTSSTALRRRRSTTPADEFNSAEEGMAEPSDGRTPPRGAEQTREESQLALVPVTSSGTARRERMSQERPSEVVQVEAIEDIPRAPEGQPQALGPRALQPLFDQEQVDRMEELERQAPMLQARRDPSPQPEFPMVAWTRTPTTELRMAETSQPRTVMPGSVTGAGRPEEMSQVTAGGNGPGMVSVQTPPPNVSMASHMLGFAPPGYPTPMSQWRDEQLRFQWQCTSELRQTAAMMKQLQEENMFLRMQLMEEREGRYNTPPENQDQGRVAANQRLEAGQRRSRGEDGLPGQGRRQAEDGAPSREGVRQEEGEDGAPSREGVQQEEGEEGPAGRQEAREPGAEAEDESPDVRRTRRRVDPTVDAMLVLMQGMQQLQQQILTQDSGRRGRGHGGSEEESLRSNIELHKLPEWSMDSAPVDFADWLLLVHSQLSDLSESSGEWWEKTLEEAKKWYREHLQLRPLDKLKHQVRLTEELKQQKWIRVSKRASNLLLQSIPEVQKEEIISGKDLSPLSIVTKLMICYQPGGHQEKAAVLTALEQPPEVSGVAEAVQGLKKWLRWKKRAEDIDVKLPDPSILLRGLDRMVAKALLTNPTVHFRVTLSLLDE